MPSGPPSVAVSPPVASRKGVASLAARLRWPAELKDTATSYAMSFVLHAAVLLSMALVIIVQVRPPSPRPITVSTLMEAGGDGGGGEFELVGSEIARPVVPAMDAPQLAGGLVGDDDARQALLGAGLTPGIGTGGGKGASSGQGEFFGTSFELPNNAVQAGSFAAWWIPKVERYGEKVEPGQLPRVGQDYRIHVLMRVPDDRKTLPVEDLSGEVVGSDGYRQVIPDRAWVQDDQGELVRTVGGRSYLPVRGQLVEVVFKVEAAGKAGVRDKIRIRSKLLKEEQVLTLEFTAELPAGGQ